MKRTNYGGRPRKYPLPAAHETQPVTAHMPVAVIEQLDRLAAERGLSRSEMVRSAIARVIAEAAATGPEVAA